MAKNSLLEELSMIDSNRNGFAYESRLNPEQLELFTEILRTSAEMEPRPTLIGLRKYINNKIGVPIGERSLRDRWEKTIEEIQQERTQGRTRSTRSKDK